MNDYDFATLNDKEFENLTIDLISRDRDKRFERFKAGRDGGIDGRYYGEDGNEEIIQCKHYLKTGYNGLISSLKKKNNGKNEADKVKILNPDRYIFVTSLSLSVSNKTKIKEIFKPYIKLDKDIYGQEDLNDLLKKYPDIEEIHSKLWIPTTNIFKRILNDTIKDKSEEEELKDKLINNYQTNFKTISLLLNDEKPIDDIFINLAIIKEQKEKDKKDKTYKREAILNSYEEIQKPKEPIEIKELLTISNKSLIYGKAGVGKTTLCKYIAYRWSKNKLYEKLDYVIYIALREWKRDGLKGAILDNYYSSDIKELYFDIKENSSKTLFLFDGYDELNATKKEILQKEIELYNLQNYIITTRPYGYQKSDFNVDESFETIGFTDENVEAYIENFFEESQKEKSLKEFLQNNINIKHIAYIPLMLEMICSLWKDEEFQESVTMTELYGQVVENILKKHSASKNDESVYKRQNRKKINEQLGALAFKGLTQQKIVFDGDFIEETLNNNDIDFFEKNTINSGFLKSDNIDKDLLDNNFEFLHLTFQEYFSALYVSKLSKEEQSKIIADWKFYPHMQMFFAFLGGLIEDKEFLLSEIESEPWDMGEVFEVLLQITCIKEMNKNNVSQDRIDNINKKLLNESLVHSIYLNLNYEIVLEALKQFSIFINLKTFNYYMQISKDDENGYYIQRDIVEALYFIANKNHLLKKSLNKLERKTIKENSLNDVIIELKKINIDNAVIISVLSSLELEEDKSLKGVYLDERNIIINILKKYGIIDEYIPIWINENFEELIDALYMEIKLEDELLLLVKEDDNLKNDCYLVLNILKQTNSSKRLLEVINREDVNSKVKIEVIYQLDNYLIYSDETIHSILDIIENHQIEDDVTSSLIDIVLPFCINKNQNNRIIPILLNRILTKNKGNRKEIVNNYIEIESSSNFYIDGLIKIINNETFLYEAIWKLAQVSNENFYAFEEFLKLEVSEEEEEGVLYEYTRYLNSSVIFNAYRNGLDVCLFIDRSFSDIKKVFYIRDNKFCTIDNGREICVDEKILEKFKGDNLND